MTRGVFSNILTISNISGVITLGPPKRDNSDHHKAGRKNYHTRRVKCSHEIVATHTYSTHAYSHFSRTIHHDSTNDTTYRRRETTLKTTPGCAPPKFFFPVGIHPNTNTTYTRTGGATAPNIKNQTKRQRSDSYFIHPQPHHHQSRDQYFTTIQTLKPYQIPTPHHHIKLLA